MASTLTPKVGTAQAWITSLEVAKTLTFELTGTTTLLSTSLRRISPSFRSPEVTK